jgi:ribosome-associated protein
MEFTLKTDRIELCRLLKATNLVMSGAEAKDVVAAGLVHVDGELETRKRCQIKAGQTIQFNSEEIRVLPPT